MNLILLFENDFVGDTNVARLTGRRFAHAKQVLRAAEGDKLCVGLAGGYTGEGTVRRLDSEVMEMDVRLDSRPPEPLPITVVMALPRPKVMRRILMSITCFGVKKIILINASRVEKSYWKTPFLEKSEMDKWIVDGLEQAKDTIPPEILLRPCFKPFVEDELPGIIEGTLPIVAHPASGEACPSCVRQPVTLAVGPEGGFIPYEVGKLQEHGFKAVSMGDRILTVEAAVPALLGRLAPVI